MTTRNQNAGIAAALLGLAGGLFAWWRYNNASPEEKERLKNKVNELGTKLKDTYTEQVRPRLDLYNFITNHLTDLLPSQ